MHSQGRNNLKIYFIFGVESLFMLKFQTQIQDVKNDEGVELTSPNLGSQRDFMKKTC
jgi:hypothetical protein